MNIYIYLSSIYITRMETGSTIQYKQSSNISVSVYFFFSFVSIYVFRFSDIYFLFTTLYKKKKTTQPNLENTNVLLTS